MNPAEPELGGLDCGYGTENKDVDLAFRVIQAAQPPRARSGRRLTVCNAAEIPEGEKRIVMDGDRSIGVFRRQGQFHAVLNVCPHQGAPICQGKINATHRPSEVHTFDPAYEGRILRCPWHGWEFDIVTGKSLHDRTGRIAIFPVEVTAAGEVVILL